MREYMVRMLIRTNARENEAELGEPYFDDSEMPRELRRWFDDALYDRDDHPEIVWSEFRMRPTLENHTHAFRLPVKDTDVCTFSGCSRTYGEERAGTEAGT